MSEVPTPPIEHGKKAAWTVVGPVILVSWHGGLCIPDLDGFYAAVRTVAAREPEGIAVLSFTFANGGVPDAATRAHLNVISANPTRNYKGTVIQMIGDGFGASVVRSVLAAVSLVRSDRAGDKVVKTLDEAVDAVASRVTVDKEQLRRVARALLASVNRSAP